MPLFGGPPDVAKLKAKKDVKGLTQALGYQKDASVRTAAAEALVALPDARAVQPLIRALGDEDVHVRRYVVDALGSIRDPRAVEPLIAALTDPYQPVRSLAAQGLGLIGDTRAIEPLVAALKHEDIRWAVAYALRDHLAWSPDNDEAGAVYWLALKEWDKCAAIGTPAVPTLVATLADPDWNKRVAGAKALGQIRDRRAVEPLIAALTDQDKDVRAAAAEALGQIRDRRAVEPLVVVLADRDQHVRAAVAKALGQIRDPRAIEPLVAALWDWGLCKTAAWALDRLAWSPDHGAAGAAYWAIKGEWDRCVSIGVPAVDILIEALNDGDAVRAAAAAAIVRIGTPAVEPLTAALRDGAPQRLISRRQLGAVVEALDKLAWSPDRGAAGATYWAVKGEWERCASIGVPAVDPLVDVLRDEWADGRSTVAAALGQIGSSRAVEPLIVALTDKQWAVRKAAAAGLVRIYRSGTMDTSQQAKILAERSAITGQHHDHTDSMTVGSHETHFDGHGDSGIGVDFPV